MCTGSLDKSSIIPVQINISCAVFRGVHAIFSCLASNPRLSFTAPKEGLEEEATESGVIVGVMIYDLI